MALFKGKKSQDGGLEDVASLNANNGDPLSSIRAMEQAENRESEENRRIRGDITKMLDQGVGSVTDLWAPPRMRIMDDYIEMGDECVAVFTVSNWPTSLSYGWLNELLDDYHLSDVKMDVSLHIHPIRKAYAQQYMKDRYISAKSSYDAAAEKGRMKQSNETAWTGQMETAQRMKSLLDQPNENLFQLALVLGIYGENQWSEDEDGNDVLVKSAHQDVIEKTRRVRKQLSRNSSGGFEIKPLLHQQREGIKSLLPWGYGGLHAFQNFYTSALATCYPFTQGKLQVEDGIVYGINNASGRPIIFDNFNGDWCKNFSCVVCGSSGTGKSATVKTLLGRYAVRGTQIFIIDPAVASNGEYTNFATSLDGSIIDFGGKSSLFFNPFELIPPSSWKRDNPTPEDEARALYIDKKGYLKDLFQLMLEIYQKENPNAVTQSSLSQFTAVIDMLVDRTYEYKGITVTQNYDYKRWTTKNCPTLNDFMFVVDTYSTIIEDYKDRNSLEGWGNTHLDGGRLRVKSPEATILHGYHFYAVTNGNRIWGKEEAAALRILSTVVGEYVFDRKKGYSAKAALFNGKEKADLTNQCIVFRLGQVQDNLKELATFLTFELIYSRLTSQGDGGTFSQKILCLDEAWKVLSSKYSRSYVEKVSREGRKLKAGLWLISQSYNDFQGENKVLFDQANTKIIFPLPENEVEQLTADLDLSIEMARRINADMSSMGQGNGLLAVRGKQSTTASFYCQQTPLELAIADTTDSTKPPLTKGQILGYDEAERLGLLTQKEKETGQLGE